MRDHSLIRLLKSFSKAEIKEFSEFISNSYFNKRKAVKKLFELIKKHYPDFSAKDLEKERIFSELFPGKKFNENSVTVMIHYLQDLAKKFIALKKFQSDKLEYNFHLESELFRRKQFSNPEKVLEKHLKELDPSEYNSEVYYLHRHRIKFDRMYYLYEANSGVYEKFMNKIDLQGTFYEFHCHYLLKSMRLYLNLLQTEKIYNKNFEKKFFEKMFKNISIADHNDVPIVQIYYYLIRMLKDSNNEKYYYEVKELLKKILGAVHYDDIHEIYINMHNFCKRKLAEGNQHFQKEEFEILIQQLRTKTYIINDCMSPIFYRNAVNSGLKLNEHSWVRNFINEFKDELREDFRKSTFLCCSAQYEFAMKNYDRALELLATAKIDEIYQKYDAKVLQMMIYYETGAEESLLSSLEAFRHFLQNNKILPGVKKKFYLNFYKFFNRIVLIRNRKDKLGLIKTKEELTIEISVSNKDWLLKKIDGILIPAYKIKRPA